MAPGSSDPHAGFGCARWHGTDRIHTCADDHVGIMPWAYRPERTDAYTLRRGKDKKVP